MALGILVGVIADLRRGKGVHDGDAYARAVEVHLVGAVGLAHLLRCVTAIEPWLRAAVRRRRRRNGGRMIAPVLAAEGGRRQTVGRRRRIGADLGRRCHRGRSRAIFLADMGRLPQHAGLIQPADESDEPRDAGRKCRRLGIGAHLDAVEFVDVLADAEGGLDLLHRAGRLDIEAAGRNALDLEAQLLQRVADLDHVDLGGANCAWNCAGVRWCPYPGCPASTAPRSVSRGRPCCGTRDRR